MSRSASDSVDPAPRETLRRRAWREWCFVRAVFLHVSLRVAMILTIVLGGAVCFVTLEPEKKHAFLKACYFTWSLVFGQGPEEFPSSHVLQVMFFAVPILGLTVIIQGIVDLALLVSDRRRYERRWCTMMAASLSNHIVLVGFGKLGFRTFRLLHRLGETVVIIESDPQCQFLEDARRAGAPILIGDARREALLIDANISQARSIILSTNDDLANLEIALDARKIKPGIRVVMRMFDQNMADKIREGFNIHIAMSQSAISAPAFAAAAMGTRVVNSFTVGDQLVVMQRWQVKPSGPLENQTVGDLMNRYNVGVVERRPKSTTPQLFPSPTTMLQAEDELLVQGAFETLKQTTVFC